MASNKNNTPIDVSTLQIIDEPHKDARIEKKTKYDEFFERVPQNQRIQCPSGKAGGLASCLRKWLIKRGHNPIIKSRERCDDGLGGVWMVEKDQKRQPVTSNKPKTNWVDVNALGKKTA